MAQKTPSSIAKLDSSSCTKLASSHPTVKEKLLQLVSDTDSILAFIKTTQQELSSLLTGKY